MLEGKLRTIWGVSIILLGAGGVPVLEHGRGVSFFFLSSFFLELSAIRSIQNCIFASHPEVPFGKSFFIIVSYGRV